MRILLFISMALFSLAGVVSADDSSGRTVWRERTVLTAGQTVQGDYAAFGRIVRISGTVNGDVYAAGWRVLVDGTINGDLIAAGGKIIVSGQVSQNVRIAAGHAVVTGTVGRNFTVGAADFQVTDTGEIRGNLLAAGGDVELDGPIGRDARIAAKSVIIADRIGRDLALAAGAIRLTSKAEVAGRLRYWGEDDAAIEDGATVHGAVTHRSLFPRWQVESFRRGAAGWRVVMTFMSAVSTLILGLLLLRIYPAFTRRVASTIRDRPWRSFGWGLAALLGIPLVAVVCVVTLVGLPIGVILMALYGVMLYLSRLYVMAWFGQVLLRRTSASSPLAWSFVTGLVVYTVLTLLPVVGELVTFLTVVWGLGALLIAEKDLVTSLRAQHVV